MKYKQRKLFALGVIGLMTLGAFLNVLAKKEYKPGDFVPEEDAYFVEKIDDPAGLVKAHKFTVPTDNKYNDQKDRSLGSGLIGDIESVWSSYTGKGTTVAIIDDGFDYDHPEYTRSDGTSAILSTSRYYYASGSSAYYQSYSSNPSCIAEDWDSGKNKWATHGTNTSTTAAAPMNNSGGVGIAPEADILALKIDFTFVAIKAAIQYAIAQNVDVINMSLGAYAEGFVDGWGESQSGSSSTSTYLNTVCQSAYDAGIIVIAAAGNESTWHKSYPACNTKVIGVGAIGDWDNKGNATTLAEFTNYVGSTQTGEINVDILAPGYVYTATQGGTSSSSHTHTYSDTQGTSFSSPIVAGAACLWKQKYPDGTPDQFLSQLQSSADGIGYYRNKYIPVSGWDSSLSDVGPSNITNGRLNVANLLDIASPYVHPVQSNISISVGEKRQIDLDTYNGTITYSSNNTNVATVSNTGLVEGKGAGTTSITVTASKNNQTASATVGVTVDAAIAATSISFNPSSITLEQGATYDAESTLSVTPSNASRIFLFKSEDESVATVDEDTGLVTAIGQGTTNINAIAGYGDGDDTLVVTVTAASTPSNWEKVTSDSDLTDGDYLIVYETGGVAFDGGLTTLDAGNNVIGVTISNSKIAYNSTTEAAKFTINSMTGGYSIKSASGSYIYGTSGSNVLNVSSSPQANSVSISGGDADIVSNTSQLRFNSDTSQNRFRYFKSSSYSNQKAIQLYKATSGGTPAPTPTVSSVTVSPSNLSLDVYNNKTGNLSATVNGTNSPAQTVTWSTSSSSVATVSNGTVTAVGVGTATITATSTVDSTKSGNCTVTVTDSTPAKTLSTIAVSTAPNKVAYTVDEYFDPTGLVITRNYSDSTSDTYTYSGHTSEFTFTPSLSTPLETTHTSVTISYGGKNCSQAITVTTSGGGGSSGDYTLVTSNSALSNGDKVVVTFNQDDSTDIEGVTGWNNTKDATVSTTSSNWVQFVVGSASSNGFTLYDSDASKYIAAPSGNEFKYSTTAGTCSVNSSGQLVCNSKYLCKNSTYYRFYGSVGSYTPFYVYLIDATIPADKMISSLTATYSGSSVYVGGTLDESKVSVTANFTDSTKYPSATLSSAHYSLSGFSSASAGTSTVIVTYTGSIPTSTTPMTTTFDVTILADNVKSISVSSSKTTAHPGETISKSNITLTATFDSGKVETKTDFTFETYQFTYADAPSGGSSRNKQFTINYAGKSASFNISVSRTAYATPSATTKTLTGTQGRNAGITGTGASGAKDYNSLSINGVTCAATNIYVYTVSGVNYFSFGTGTGEIRNTQPLDKAISSLTIDHRSGARTDEKIYVSTDGSNYVLLGSADLANNDYRYFKIAYEATSSTYSNFNNINIGQRSADTPTNVANYIMYEDTTNQCLTKFDSAVNKLKSMSSSDQSTFMTSTDYVISTARERLQAWARSLGKTIELSNGSITVSSTGLAVMNSLTGDNFNSTIVVAIISVTSLGVIAMYFFLRKKRAQ